MSSTELRIKFLQKSAQLLSEYQESKQSLRAFLRTKRHALESDFETFSTIEAISLGVIRYQNTLDYLLASSAWGVNLSQLDANSRNLLRVIVYSARWLDYSPKDAAVRLFSNHARLATISLKAAGQDLENATKRLKRENKLSVKYAHPTFFVETLLQNLSYEESIALMEANNSVRDQYLRVNRLIADKEQVLLDLQNLGVELREEDSKNVFRIESGFEKLIVSELFESGTVLIQDKSSVKAVQALNPLPGDIVWDACAAPGMKTHLIEECLDSSGAIFATDISEERLNTARDRSKKLGMSLVEWIHADAITSPVTEASKILIDAPCTSSGMIRSHPSFKWRVNKETLMALMSIQNKILDGILSKYSDKPGTEIVYATCSIFPHEGESQIDSAMTRHSLELVELPIECAKGYPGFNCTNKVGRLFPHTDRSNGFFIAKFKITE